MKKGAFLSLLPSRTFQGRIQTEFQPGRCPHRQKPSAWTRNPVRGPEPQCMDQKPTAWTRNPPYRLLPGSTFFSRKGISNFSLVSRDASRNLIQKCQQISRRRKEREMRTKISSRVDPQGTLGMKFQSRWPCLSSTCPPCPPSLGA